MSQGGEYIKRLRLDIAASLVLSPCTEEELYKRDFLKGIRFYNVQRLVMQLEKEAIFYKGDTLHIKKSWARKNLKEYELDLRTDRQKYLDSLSDFQKSYLGIK